MKYFYGSAGNRLLKSLLLLAFLALVFPVSLSSHEPGELDDEAKEDALESLLGAFESLLFTHYSLKPERIRPLIEANSKGWREPEKLEGLLKYLEEKLEKSEEKIISDNLLRKWIAEFEGELEKPTKEKIPVPDQGRLSESITTYKKAEKLKNDLKATSLARKQMHGENKAIHHLGPLRPEDKEMLAILKEGKDFARLDHAVRNKVFPLMKKHSIKSKIPSKKDKPFKYLGNTNWGKENIPVFKSVKYPNGFEQLIHKSGIHKGEYNAIRGKQLYKTNLVGSNLGK